MWLPSRLRRVGRAGQTVWRWTPRRWLILVESSVFAYGVAGRTRAEGDYDPCMTLHGSCSLTNLACSTGIGGTKDAGPRYRMPRQGNRGLEMLPLAGRRSEISDNSPFSSSHICCLPSYRKL